MGKTAVIVTVACVCAGLGATGWFAYDSLRPKTSSIASVCDVIPADVVYYAESQDLAATLEAAQGTEAWTDLSNSALIKDGDSPLHLALESLQEVSRKIQYPLDENNLPKFIGRDLAFGVRLDEQLTRAEWVAVTRLDVDALAKDLLAGKLDWRALEAELHARSQKADVTVELTEFKDYRIAKLSRGGHVVHAVIMEDLLAVADSPRMLERVVDLRLAAGVGGLSSSPKFKAEMALLQGDAALRDWVDLERVGALRGVASACWEASFGGDGKAAPPWMFDGVLDATDGRPALARAIALPGGDLYRVHWTWSRAEDDIFNDDVHGDVDAVVEDDALFYVEARDLGAVVDAWNASNLKRGLLDSEFAKWVAEMTDDPTGSIGELEKLAPMGRGAMSRAVPEFDGSLRFFLRFGWNALEQGVRTMLRGDASLAVYAPETGDDPRVLGIVRLGVDGRMALHALLDAAVREEGAELSRVGTLDGRDVFATAAPEVRMTLVGDALVVGNDSERFERAVRRLVSGGPSDSSIAAEARDAGPDRRLHVRVASGRLIESLAGAFGDQPDDPLGMLKGAISDSYTLSVTPQLREVKVHVRSRFDPEVTDGFMWRSVRLLHNGTSASRAAATDDTVVHMAMFMDIPGTMNLARSVNPEEFDRFLDRATDELGFDPRKDLFPALGDEIALEVDRNLDRTDPSSPPIPGVVLSIGVRDSAAVDKALRLIADSLLRDFDRQQQTRRGRGGDLNRSALADGVLYTVEIPGTPVRPTFGRMGAFARVGLTERPVRARSGSAPVAASFVAKPAVRRALETMDPESSVSMIVDFGALVDQIQVYSTDMTEAFSGPPDGLDDLPDDLSDEEWQRRYEELVKQQQERAGTRGQRVAKALDVLRLLEFFSVSGRALPDGSEAVWTYGFK